MNPLEVAKRLKKLRGQLSHRQFGLKVGLSDASLIRFEQGKQNPKIDSLKKIASACGVDISYFYDELKPVQQKIMDVFEVPLVSDIAAGFTDLSDEIEVSPKIKLPFDECKGCIAFKVKGSSMEPLYYEGDILIVKDRKDLPPKDGHVYVVEWEEDSKIQRAVKYVHIIENGFLLASKNRKHKSKSIDNIRKLYRIVLEITHFHEQLA